MDMEFILIQPGTFLMGSPESEEGRYSDETQHKVTLTKPFYMQATPVTQAQWQAVMGNNPSDFKGDNLPVENVSWNDCQEFIQHLNQRGEGQYRLPTEAEWEYAARAGRSTPFGIGNGRDLDSTQANFDGNYPYGAGRKGLYREKTTPVKSFAPNAWGLYDMHGNVYEWVQDWYGAYPSETVSDPQEADLGKCRVMRGGSWSNFARSCRSAFRSRYRPDDGDCYIGFRLVKEVE
jgi:formylglycine-generating enzyme required for sulfatase activity